MPSPPRPAAPALQGRAPPALLGRAPSLIDAHKLIARAAAAGGELGAGHVPWSPGVASSRQQQSKFARELRATYTPLSKTQLSPESKLCESDQALRALQAELAEALELIERLRGAAAEAIAERAEADRALAAGKAEAQRIVEEERRLRAAAEEEVRRCREEVQSARDDGAVREITQSAREAELQRALQEAVIDLREMDTKAGAARVEARAAGEAREAAEQEAALSDRLGLRAVVHAWQAAARTQAARRRHLQRWRDHQVLRSLLAWHRPCAAKRQHAALAADLWDVFTHARLSRGYGRWRRAAASNARLVMLQAHAQQSSHRRRMCIGLEAWHAMLARRDEATALQRRLWRRGLAWFGRRSSRGAWRSWRRVALDSRCTARWKQHELMRAWACWVSLWVSRLGQIWRRGCETRAAALTRLHQRRPLGSLRKVHGKVPGADETSAGHRV